MNGWDDPNDRFAFGLAFRLGRAASRSLDMGDEDDGYIGAAQQVILDTYSKFDQCAMTFAPIASTTSTVVGEEQMLSDWFTVNQSSIPPQFFLFVHMLFGATLLFFGFMLVRPINFAFGAYLSGSIALLLLKALVKTHATCTIIFWIPVLVAMVFGSLAAWKRGSIFGLLGLIAGEVAGRYFYNILLRPFAAPEQLAYTCIGFFAVVVSRALLTRARGGRVGLRGGRWLCI
jgi:hypothetical protein